MKVETDLQRIKKLAQERQDENFDFRAYLKRGRHGENVDDLVHRINEEVCAAIDCTTCANCCEVTRTCMSKADIERMAAGLSITPEAFREQYMEKDEYGEDVLRGLPCAFLEDKRCTLYEHRPIGCRSYPHLHKDEFTSRLLGVVSNYETCPIVFNVYERLKVELGWRRRKRKSRC